MLDIPTQMLDNEGSHVCDMELDIYGKVRTFGISSLSDCPFRYQGQYLDQETGLYYNRFRYYDPEVGSYISIDPIGLFGRNPTLYGYVHNINMTSDALGLKLMSPSDILLSHDAKASTTFGGFYSDRTVQDLANDIIKDEIRIADAMKANPNLKRIDLDPLADSIPPLEVGKNKGKLYSANNRRLKAFQIAEKSLKKLGVKLKVNTTPASKAEMQKIADRLKNKH